MALTAQGFHLGSGFQNLERDVTTHYVTQVSLPDNIGLTGWWARGALRRN